MARDKVETGKETLTEVLEVLYCIGHIWPKFPIMFGAIGPKFLIVYVRQVCQYVKRNCSYSPP